MGQRIVTIKEHLRDIQIEVDAARESVDNCQCAIDQIIDDIIGELDNLELKEDSHEKANHNEPNGTDGVCCHGTGQQYAR